MRSLALVAALLLLVAAPATAADLQPRSVTAYERYIRLTDQRFDRDVQTPLAARPGGGAVPIIRARTTDENGGSLDADDALIHHWKGAVFIPGASLDQVLQQVQDYNRHSRYFQEVEKSRLISRQGDRSEERRVGKECRL